MVSAEDRVSHDGAEPLPIPQRLADAIHFRRIPEVCPFFRTPTGCRSGMRCKLRHDGLDTRLKLPCTSRYTGQDGHPRITVRAPVQEAFKDYFADNARSMPLVTPGEAMQIELQTVRVYGLQNMKPRDDAACASAKARGDVLLEKGVVSRQTSPVHSRGALQPWRLSAKLLVT